MYSNNLLNLYVGLLIFYSIIVLGEGNQEKKEANIQIDFHALTSSFEKSSILHRFELVLWEIRM